MREGITQRNPSFSWWCTRVKLPDDIGTVDDLIAVVDKEDVQIDRYISDGNYVQDPHIQIYVRGVGLDRCYDKIKEVSYII